MITQPSWTKKWQPKNFIIELKGDKYFISNLKTFQVYLPRSWASYVCTTYVLAASRERKWNQGCAFLLPDAATLTRTLSSDPLSICTLKTIRNNWWKHSDFVFHTYEEVPTQKCFGCFHLTANPSYPFVAWHILIIKYSICTIFTQFLKLKTFFQGFFSLKFLPYVWLVFKSGFLSRAGYSCARTVYVS